MRKLHLTFNDKEVYERVMEFINQFPESQIQIELTKTNPSKPLSI